MIFGTGHGKTWLMAHMHGNDLPPRAGGQRRYRITIERTMATKTRPGTHVIAVVECWAWDWYGVLKAVLHYLIAQQIPEPRYGSPPVIRTIPHEVRGEVISDDVANVARPANPPTETSNPPGREGGQREITGRIYPPGMRPPDNQGRTGIG